MKKCNESCFGLTRQQLVDILTFSFYCGMCVSPISVDRQFGITTFDQRFTDMLQELATKISANETVDLTGDAGFSALYNSITADLELNKLRLHCEENKNGENSANKDITSRESTLQVSI